MSTIVKGAEVGKEFNDERSDYRLTTSVFCYTRLAMSEPDELYTLRNLYWLGNYQVSSGMLPIIAF